MNRIEHLERAVRGARGRKSAEPWPPAAYALPSTIEAIEAERLDGQQRLTLAREENRNMDCVNLRERFGRQYRVEHEESYYAQHGHHARVADPWLMVIPCVHGHIYPHGGNMLAASVDGHPNVAGALWRLKCCRVQQNGDFGELTVLFDVADFAKVAAVMRSKWRRVMSEAQKGATGGSPQSKSYR